jgi:hypothetical protein
MLATVDIIGSREIAGVWHGKCAGHPLPPYFFRKDVIPWEFLSRFIQGCDSKGVKYKGGKFGIGNLWEARIGENGAGRDKEAGASGCRGRMRSFSNSHIYLFYRASKEGLVEKAWRSRIEWLMFGTFWNA